MTGPEPESVNEEADEHYYGYTTDGVIPRATSYIFELMERTPDRKYEITVSYLELYNELVCNSFIISAITSAIRYTIY